MKTIPLVILIIVLSLGGSFVLTRILEMSSIEEDAAIAKLSSRIDVLSESVSDLTAKNLELTETIQALRAEEAFGRAPVGREPVPSLKDAVDQWIRENRPDLLPADEQASALEPQAEVPEGSKREQAAQMLALLDVPELDDAGWNEVWKKIDEAGLMEEALAILEENVAKDPNNADAHVALAGGYIGKLMNTANDMEKGIYAVKADRTLDRALELDPWHWEARFTKAISLTFYPPVMGKQGEAMKHFEILLDQQKKLPPKADFAQTYLYLGNLHQQMGNHDKASKIWKEGIALFPNNAELLAQLENALKD